MHTNDMLTGRRLCTCADLETHFTLICFRNLGSSGQRVRHTCIAAHERVTFSDIAEVVVLWSICMLMMADTKMSLFQPNCFMKFFISRCFSATVNQNRATSCMV